MPSTTIKVESDLLKDITRVKPKEQSISAFVREVLERDIRRRKMKEAAHEYQKFLAGQPEEEAEMEAWESARLSIAPAKKRR